MSYVRILTICLLLVYFVSAAGCHCVDFFREGRFKACLNLDDTYVLWHPVSSRTLIVILPCLPSGLEAITFVV